MLYYAGIADTHPITRPKVSEEQAIMVAKAEPIKNSWFFNASSETAFSVLDFNSTYYIAEDQFLRDGHSLPLVLIQANGTLLDVNGQVKDMLSICKEEPGFGWCEFFASLRPQSSKGDLAYLVGLEWSSGTELFVVDAARQRVLNSTIYSRPILYLEEVQSQLEKIGGPKLSQDEALRRVEDDLKSRYPGEFERITHLVYNRHSYMPIEEFEQRQAQLPLIYIHPSGTLVFVNGTNVEMGYYCESGVYTFCGFAEPFNLDSEGRLVYGIELAWNPGIPDSYAVDAITGEIVDSGSLRTEARNRNNAS